MGLWKWGPYVACPETVYFSETVTENYKTSTGRSSCMLDVALKEKSILRNYNVSRQIQDNVMSKDVRLNCRRVFSMAIIKYCNRSSIAMINVIF